MKRALITGANGLLGSSLAPYLRVCGYEVICVGLNTVLELRADLTDTEQVDSTLDKIRPDVIVNLAACTNVDDCERKPYLAYLSNVRIVENLAKWIRNNENECHLVQISTDQLYDGKGPHKESDVVLTNYYGFSKYAGELASATVPSAVLRTNFVGLSKCATRKSLSDWLFKSLTHGDVITVFEDVCFSPLTLHHLVIMVEHVIQRRSEGVYNLGSKDSVSKAGFAYAFAEALGFPTHNLLIGTMEDAKLAAYRPKDMSMDSSKFESVFNIELPTIKEEIQFLQGVYANEVQ